MEEVISKGGFTLPDEVITLKFLPKKKGMAANVDDNHVIAGNMLAKSIKRFFAPLAKRGGGIMNVLTNEEKEYLENVTGRNLSVYGDFWTEFSVKLGKEDSGNRLYLSNPNDYLAYCILRASSDEIAPSWKAREQKGTYVYAIVRESEIQDEKKSKLDLKKDAFKLYGKLEDDREKLISILQLVDNKLISADSKLTWLQGKVEEIVDTNPKKFLSIVQDGSFETKSLINKGVTAGVILKKSNKYSTIDGLELAEDGEMPSFDNAVRYLDSPKNQEVRSLIEARIDNAD